MDKESKLVIPGFDDQKDPLDDYRHVISQAYFSVDAGIDRRENQKVFCQKIIDLNESYQLSGINGNEKVLIFFILSIFNQFCYEIVMKNSKDFQFLYEYPLDIIFLASISDFHPMIMHLKDTKNLSENKFNNDVLAHMTIQILYEISYNSVFIEKNYLLSEIVEKFIANQDLNPTGIHDMIEYSHQLCMDYAKFDFPKDTPEEKFIICVFGKIADFFFQVAEKGFSPFLSAAIFKEVNEMKQTVMRDIKFREELCKKLETVMEKIRERMNKVRMTSTKQSETLPYYFLDLSATSLHKLMELNPKTKIPFTLSPYILKKDLPNIEKLTLRSKDRSKLQSQNQTSQPKGTQEDDDDEYLSPNFDSMIFSCSPTSDSTIAVVRNIFVEYDRVSERLVDRKNIPPSVYKQKQTSTVPGMLVFKLSMLQWDCMPNFTLTSDFVSVFQVPYSSINKLGFQPIEVNEYDEIVHDDEESLSFSSQTISSFSFPTFKNKTQPKTKNRMKSKPFKKINDKNRRYYIDIHTPDYNLCFYPLTYEEIVVIEKFLVTDIGIEKYDKDTYKNFFEKTKNEMSQRAANTIRMMIDQQVFPKCDSDTNLYELLFKTSLNTRGMKEVSDQDLKKVIEVLCKYDDKDSSTLLLESLCYVCQKDQGRAFKAMDYFEAEMMSADSQKKSHMLMILNRFFDPTILQLSQALIEKARKWTESAQFLFNVDSDRFNDITPKEIAKKVISGAEGAQFFALTSEDQEERFGLPEIHRAWLEKSVPIEDEY